MKKKRRKVHWPAHPGSTTRLKIVRHADQILVADNGRIVQCGTLGELITEPGIYADFVTGRKEAVGWRL